MTLGQFATAVGVAPRWVLNALTRLRVPRRYSEPLARRLSLARMLAEEIGITLPNAWTFAGRALAETDPHGSWRLESDSGAVAVVVDFPRFYSSYLPRLSLSRSSHGEKLRGRRPKRRGSALERARAWGMDTSLLESALDRTPAQRLTMVAENMEALASLRGSMHRKGR